MKIEGIFRNFYFYLLIFIAVSLPLSEFTLSVSIILLAINWIIEGKFSMKLQVLVNRRSLLVFLSIYLIHLLGLLYTSDFTYALKDLKVKLPLLAIPLIIGTSEPLTSKQIKTLNYFFIFSVLIASIISTYVYLGLADIEITDSREISIFVSHIRFSLLIDVAIVCSTYYLLYKLRSISNLEKYFLIVSNIWLSVYLFVILKALTGIVIYLIIIYLIIIAAMIHIHNKRLRILLKTALLLFPLMLIFYLGLSINRFYQKNEAEKTGLNKHTVNGNPYNHNINSTITENGHYVYINICEKELKNEWEKLSIFRYSGTDKRGQAIRSTLIRYLTSKGLTKDSIGISMLSLNDVANIENGLTNHLFAEKHKLYPKLYEFLWEIENYRIGANPSGHSVTQRIEYVKTALLIVKDNLWIGTGTGDVAVSYKMKYEEINTKLNKRWQLRAHNQYITIMLTFGIIGFAWFAFAYLFPVFYEQKWGNYFFVFTFIILSLSMINEDTLETHTGASMCAFFYSLFLFGIKNSAVSHNK